MTVGPGILDDLLTGRYVAWPLDRKLGVLAALRRVSLPEDLLSWTIKHRPFLVPGQPLDFVSHHYLTPIYQETSPWMIIYKSSQMGASEYLVSYALHGADQRAATVLYVFPTDVHLSDFSSGRVGPAIEASPYLTSIVVDAGGRSRGADRVRLKRIRDRFLYFRGAKVSPDGLAPQLKAIAADILLLDELDEMDSRAPEIARKRLGHSMLAEERTVSTPTYRGIGIHALWERSDQREWVVACPHCGERQYMDRSSVILEEDSLGRPVGWYGMETGSAWPACRKCRGRLERLAQGEWVPTYPGKIPVGYHLCKLFSPLADVGAMVRGLQAIDETARREATNQDWGEPYTPRGGQLTDDILQAATRAYSHGPVAGERCRMGVDVGDLLHVIIRGPAQPETGDYPQRYAGTVAEFADVIQLMRLYNCEICVVDGLPETREARRFQDSFPPGRIWRAYYVTQKIGLKIEEPVRLNLEEGFLDLDRTRTIDEMYARVLAAATGGLEPAQVTFSLPCHARGIPDYYTHLKAMIRILEDHVGRKVAVYISTGADHWAHAENYCCVAWTLPHPSPLPDQSRLKLKSSVWN